MASAITGNGAMIGFLGIYHPRKNTADRSCHFTTRSIHSTKIKELEAQQQLRESNMDLAALLAAEKKNTAIISSLSNVFFALYYIDLKENTFQEIVSQDKIHHTMGEKETPGMLCAT